MHMIYDVKDRLATKYMKKLYLQKCVNVLRDFTLWNRENTGKLSLAKKFYSLNLMMKSLSGLKVVSKSGRIQKNNKIMNKKFHNYHLLERVFKLWKKLKYKKSYLRRKLKKYLQGKEKAIKKRYMSEWQFAYDSQVKVPIKRKKLNLNRYHIIQNLNY